MRRLTTMDSNEQVQRQRLAVLRLAEKLGNDSEACRRCGVDRTSFYQWRRRFARDGLEGLDNRRPVRTSHPQTTPAAIATQIAKLALASPAHGCDRIANSLAKRGVDVSAVTIQKILHKSGLGTYETRAAALEAIYASGTKKLTAAQTIFLENINPCFRERYRASNHPGEVLCAGSFLLGRLEELGPVYVHAVVDGFSSYAFGRLSATTSVEETIALLHKRALPFFAARRCSVCTVTTNRASGFTTRKLADYLSRVEIDYRAGVGESGNGFVESFRRAVLKDFLRTAFRPAASRPALTRLRSQFETWLSFYNSGRSQQGYRNYGKTPGELI